MGHFTRCLALAGELRGYGCEIAFICRPLIKNLLDNIQRQGYSFFEIASLSWKDDCARVKAILSEQKKAIDWLIVDHYGLDQRWEKSLRPHTQRIMVIDDLANRKHDCDLLLDQNTIENFKNRYDGLVPKHSLKLLGPQYVLLRKEFHETRKHLKRQRTKTKRILIFFGKQGPVPVLKTLKAIARLNKPHLQVDVAADGKHNQIEFPKIPHLFFHKHIDNMAACMARADLAIGAGGSATWERCCLGLPSIVMVFSENQHIPTRTTAKEGRLINLGWHESVTVERLYRQLKILFENPRRREALSRRARALVDGTGAKRVAMRMVSLMIQAPKDYYFELLGQKHTGAILKWRNDPEVKTLFKEQTKLTARAQSAFLDAYPQKDRLDFVLMESCSGRPVGVFNLKNVSSKMPEIGQLIGEKSHRGRGLGKKATASLLAFAFQQLNLKALFAYVQKRNHVNVNLLSKLKFNIKKAERVDNQDYLLMKLSKENFQNVGH